MLFGIILTEGKWPNGMQIIICSHVQKTQKSNQKKKNNQTTHLRTKRVQIQGSICFVFWVLHFSTSSLSEPFSLNHMCTFQNVLRTSVCIARSNYERLCVSRILLHFGTELQIAVPKGRSNFLYLLFKLKSPYAIFSPY